jgi:SOS response associated peptidase (SRAP)
VPVLPVEAEAPDWRLWAICGLRGRRAASLLAFSSRARVNALGLVPYWWKKPLKELPATFNARAESVATKPMFGDALKRYRCIVPASASSGQTASSHISSVQQTAAC